MLLWGAIMHGHTVDARIIAPPRTLDAVVLSRPERVKSAHAPPPGLPNFSAGGGEETVRAGATNSGIRGIDTNRNNMWDIAGLALVRRNKPAWGGATN